MALPYHLSRDPGVQQEAIMQDGVPTTSHLQFNVPVEMRPGIKSQPSL